MSASTYSTASASATVTIQGLRDALSRVSAADRLADWMRGQGFDPEKGARLVLPDSLAWAFAPWGPPTYVVLSRIVEQPILMRGLP